MNEQPLLAVDIDGVISLFGFEEQPVDGSCRPQLVDGVLHFISLSAGERLIRLSEHFELIWASGWGEKANFYLPELLGLPELPHLDFGIPSPGAHWKLAELEDYVGERAVAWIDDNFDESCYEWAERRPAPTLLVPTEPHLGLEEGHVDALTAWATSLH